MTPALSLIRSTPPKVEDVTKVQKAEPGAGRCEAGACGPAPPVVRAAHAQSVALPHPHVARVVRFLRARAASWRCHHAAFPRP